MVGDLKAFLDALKLPTAAMLGLCVASLILLSFYSYGVLNLADFGAATKPLLIVLAVVFGSLSVVQIAALLLSPLFDWQRRALLSQRRAIRRQEYETDRAEAQCRVLDRLEHLSGKELKYIADCLREGSQSFYTYVHSPPVTTMGGKGLIYTPGGTHHQDHYPFSFHDFVWKELVSRRDEFIKRSEDYEREKEEEEKARQRARRGRY